jgi:hypothetical protein
MSPTCVAQRLRAKRHLKAATGTLALPPRAQLPTCVHARIFALARLRHLPALHRGLRATCRPSTSAIVRSTSTPASHPDPKRCPRRRTAPRLDGTTLASGSSRTFTGQGLPTFAVNPHRDDRSPQRIYPNLIDPDTSCRKLVPNSPWIEKPGCRAVYGFFRTNSPGLPRFHATRLVGPPPTLPREREHTQPHPRCLPPSALFKDESQKSGHHVPARSPHRGHSSPMPFLLSLMTTLTRPPPGQPDRPSSDGRYRLSP